MTDWTRLVRRKLNGFANNNPIREVEQIEDERHRCHFDPSTDATDYSDEFGKRSTMEDDDIEITIVGSCSSNDTLDYIDINVVAK